MAEIIRENPVGDFIQDMLDVLEANTFDEIIWVGMHGWLAYVTRVFWLKGYKMETVITNTDSRWGQEAYEDEDGHKLRFTSLDYAKEVGNQAVYIIANRHVEELKAQLMDLGISGQRIFGFKDGVTYHKEANNRLTEKMKGYRRMTHKEVQGVLLNLLREFKRFCEEQGLTYFLDGGTLLGAVRHQGFIPWDNDVDVHMPIEDYKKFISLYPSSEEYEVIDWTNHEQHRLGYAELGSNCACVHIPHYVAIEPIHIDILPLIEFPSSPAEMDMKCEEHRKLSQRWRECAILSAFGVKDDCKAIWDCFYTNQFSGSGIIGDGYFTEASIKVYHKDGFLKTQKIMFEGEEFSAPFDYEERLRVGYGDYMNLPAVNERVGYPNKFYWK